MKILITNDDGIDSPVLPLLAKWASKLGEVTVVAPKVEQSAKSQAIWLQEMEVTTKEIAPGITAYAVDSTPADCVRFGVHWFKTEYDLILSGGIVVVRALSYSFKTLKDLWEERV